MSHYIDGFVLPVPKDKIDQYRDLAAKAGAIWKEHGALAYIEAVGDDLEIKEMTSFTTMANAKPEETVVFAYIVYESREQRDAVNAKVMEDPRMKDACPSVAKIFDFRRMAYGGFKTIVEA